MNLSRLCKGVRPYCKKIKSQKAFVKEMFKAAGNGYISDSYAKQLYSGGKPFTDELKSGFGSTDRTQELITFFEENITDEEGVIIDFGIPEKKDCNKKALCVALTRQMQELINGTDDVDDILAMTYEAEKTNNRIGVQGEVKNIIFAAKYKPEIVFDDALNNDIRITKNENQCLIYNRPIPPTGVMWNDLVDWYAEEMNIDENREIVFIKRLCECLDTSFKAQGAKSGPETWMLQAYYNLKKELGKDLPALIPQVYLYYDPQTLKQRGYKLFEHQKMDFLMVFSHKDRVVIEIDGRQHYAEGNSASPRLYSEMVRAQREMTLFGYDVYRFGGYEFVGADSDEKKKEAVLDDLKQFFLRLFSKYSAL